MKHFSFAMVVIILLATCALVTSRSGAHFGMPVFDWKAIVSLSLTLISAFAVMRLWRNIKHHCEEDHHMIISITILITFIIMMTAFTCGITIWGLIIVDFIAGIIAGCFFISAEYGIIEHSHNKKLYISAICLINALVILITTISYWFTMIDSRRFTSPEQPMLLWFTLAIAAVGIIIGIIIPKKEVGYC